MIRSLIWALCGLALAFPRLARADEGMWLFNDFPSARVKEKYGFDPTAKWLDHVQLSSVRLAGGCSGSIVSPEGLVMTNHHCAHSCIEQLSTARHDFVATGFYAKTAAEEVKCPEIEINQLIEISDVTARVNTATKGLAAMKYNVAQKAEMSRIEKECATSENVRCDVVTLYHGGKYNLYKYRRFQDVRLVMAPEFAIAFFGGDPDNFEFPRYDLDVSFLRIYENGQPLKAADYLPFSSSGPKDGELVFVSGHPGTTKRLTPIAQLELDRDLVFPDRLLYASELRGILEQLGTESAEKKRISSALLFMLDNGIKARRGMLQALQDPAFFAQLVQREAALRAKVEADAKLKSLYGGAWAAVAQAMARFRTFYVRYNYIETGRGFVAEQFDLARLLVRAAEEVPKPNPERLREYADSNLPALRQKILSTAPIYDDLEIVTLTYSLTKLRAALGADDPFVRQVLGKQSPRELATALVKASTLRDVKVRKALLDGGAKAVAASNDPFIRLAREIDPEARAVRKVYEDEVEAPVKQANEQIAQAHFAVFGMSTYPDAT
ncbi:MAG TPA: S46 family peptidase, partial [Anaeromyxobacteraceae bacterium]|nr:S46 family peptidase [Anaeromyxobacteraceae bacterium]